jgi:hypothetical protein
MTTAEYAVGTLAAVAFAAALIAVVKSDTVRAALARVRAGRDRGMATAEFAVALPAAVLVLVVGLTAILAGIDQVRCVDAARLAARSLARGDSQAEARGLARGAAPGGASIEVSVTGDRAAVTVSVERRVGLLGLSWVVRSTSVAPREAVPP